jgi:hypothetical protein
MPFRRPNACESEYFLHLGNISLCCRTSCGTLSISDIRRITHFYNHPLVCHRGRLKETRA